MPGLQLKYSTFTIMCFNKFNHIPPEKISQSQVKTIMPVLFHGWNMLSLTYPIPSMYGIVYIHHKNQTNVGEYTIDELFGYWVVFLPKKDTPVLLPPKKKNANDSPKAHGDGFFAPNLRRTSSQRSGESSSRNGPPLENDFRIPEANSKSIPLSTWMSQEVRINGL